MTAHFFNHQLVNLHYYRFGNGPKIMLCFHGYGMHGKQFSLLKEKFGNDYTFYGFDLFFHKETKLHDQSISSIKRGISKEAFIELIKAFCDSQSISNFSLIGYSLGTHYATVLAETKSFKIDKLLILAPSFLKIFPPFKVMASNYVANLAFRKLLLSKNGIKLTLKICKKIGFLDAKSYAILNKEMGTPELRFAFYANVTYLRFLQAQQNSLVEALNEQNVKCYFIFGQRDKMYPNHLADELIAKLNFASKTTLDEDHDLVNENLSANIYNMIYDH